jgi:hypothetical protein
MRRSQRSQHPPAWLTAYHAHLSTPDTTPNGLVNELLAEQRRMSAEVEQHVFAIFRNLSAQILDAIKPTYSATPIDLHVACPQSFYDLLTRGLTSYRPRRIRAGYSSYSMCTNTALFYAHFPDQHFGLTFPYAGTPLDYSLVASPDHPICTLYSPALCDLALHLQFLVFRADRVQGASPVLFALATTGKIVTGALSLKAQGRSAGFGGASFCAAGCASFCPNGGALHSLCLVPLSSATLLLSKAVQQQQHGSQLQSRTDWRRARPPLHLEPRESGSAMRHYLLRLVTSHMP